MMKWFIHITVYIEIKIIERNMLYKTCHSIVIDNWKRYLRCLPDLFLNEYGHCFKPTRSVIVWLFINKYSGTYKRKEIVTFFERLSLFCICGRSILRCLCTLIHIYDLSNNESLKGYIIPGLRLCKKAKDRENNCLEWIVVMMHGRNEVISYFEIGFENHLV